MSRKAYKIVEKISKIVYNDYRKLRGELCPIHQFTQIH